MSEQKQDSLYPDFKKQVNEVLTTITEIKNSVDLNDEKTLDYIVIDSMLRMVREQLFEVDTAFRMVKLYGNKGE